MEDEHVISTLPVLPIKRAVLFPGIMMPLTIGRDRSVAAVEAALKTEEKTLIVVAQRNAEQESPRFEELYTVGTKGVIKQVGRTPEGRLHAIVQGVERVVLLKAEQTEPFFLARSRPMAPPTDTGPEIDALQRAILDMVNELPKVVQTSGINEVVEALHAERDPAALGYRIASLLNLTVEVEQDLF